MKKKKKRLGSDAFDESPLGSLIRDTRSKETQKQKKKVLFKPKNLKEKEEKIEKYKHTDIQTKEGKISEVGERATFYIKPDILTEIKIISIRIKSKNLSELVNEAIEDLINKYNKNSSK